MSDVTGEGRAGRIEVICIVLFLSTALVGVGIGFVAAETVTHNTDPHQQTETRSATVENLTFEGEGYDEAQYEMIAEHPEPPFVWQDSELRLNATIESGSDSGTYYLCARAYSENGDSSVEFDCREFTLSDGNEVNVAIGIDAWPENATGEHTIVVELYKSGLSEDVTIHESITEVFVIERDGDLTGDGLTNEEEFQYGTDITRPDTSGNGLTDWEEVKKYGTNPLESDTTGDGISDSTLVRIGLDPTVPYLLHQYLAGGVIVAAIITGGTIFWKRRHSDSNPVAVDRVRETAPYESESGRIEEMNGFESDGQSAIDESILTNEEIVCHALKRNDGRMRQSQIVDSTEWSKAKVSRVLSELEENGVIQRIRIGRENVVDLNEEEMDTSEVTEHGE